MKIIINKNSKILNEIFFRLVDLVAKTWRIKVIGEIPKGIAIVTFWHGYMLPVWSLFKRQGMSALVSQSEDGQILSRVLEKWGFKLIRGSSSQGGKEALMKIHTELKSNSLLITPDGPRGPRYQMKAGAVISAVNNNVPLYIVKPTISKKIIFNKSWDHFSVPLPFTKITIEISEPLRFKEKATKDEMKEFISETDDIMNKFYFG